MKRAIVVVAAIISLTILECVALSHGINGTMFSIVIATIAALGGRYSTKLKLNKLNKNGD